MGMKKIFAGVVLGVMLPVVAFAAPTGWKSASECVQGDNKIYDASNGVVTGCIEAVVWQKALAAAASLDDYSKLGQYIFQSGSTKLGSNHVLYECPWWFGPFSCILPEFAR
jgi:hypothetical protein